MNPDRNASQAPDTRRHTGLLRVTGSVVIALSALSQEYGSGINFVVPHGLQSYPGVENLVPLAIFVAGIVLIPQVALFSRFARVMPTAGSSYVWLTRTLGPMVGYAVSFVWLIGLCGSMGFVAYVCATFLGNTFDSIGLHSAWLGTGAGHLVVGLASIWSLAALHCTGIKRYGKFIYVVGALVLVAAAIIVVTGFSTSPDVGAAKLMDAANVHAAARPAQPSLLSFFSVVALFIFAYGGLAGGASLGGEASNPARSMPRGIVAGWALALVLYTLVTFALFHAVPWWIAVPIIDSGQASLLTVPSLIGLLTPTAIAFLLNLLITIVVIKTIAPQLLCASRFLYAWAEDGFMPRHLQSTNRTHAPATAIIVSAVLGSLFLVDAVFSGWSIGVVVRSISLMITFTMLGIGILWLTWSHAHHAQRAYAGALTDGWFVKVMAVAAVIIGLPLIVLVSHEAGKAWYFQPWFQLIVIVFISVAVTVWARRHHDSRHDFPFHLRFLKVPEE